MTIIPIKWQAEKCGKWLTELATSRKIIHGYVRESHV